MRLSRDKKQVMRLLNYVNRLNRLDRQIFNLTKPQDKYDKNHVWWFLDFYNTLDIVYLEMFGVKRDEVHGQFRAPSSPTSKNIPVAWYKTQFNTDKDGYKPGPKGYTGYIPDKIDDVILDPKLNAEQKHKLLVRMFKDLARIKENHESTK